MKRRRRDELRAQVEAEKATFAREQAARTTLAPAPKSNERRRARASRPPSRSAARLAARHSAPEPVGTEDELDEETEALEVERLRLQAERDDLAKRLRAATDRREAAGAALRPETASPPLAPTADASGAPAV